jgi:hypothetical protein
VFRTSSTTAARGRARTRPFDATNAPEEFSGFGNFHRDGDVLTFSDSAGAKLRFTPTDGTPDPYNCA